ncbi:MAG: hypothetical protein NVSMB25_07470 [Thermoleophilaceae bacterium]
MILIRYREALAGRVLELGSGAGRLTGYLAAVAQSVHGLDVSERMVAHGRRRYPDVTFEQGDLRDLSRYESGSFDAVIAPYNVLDVLGDSERAGVLEAVRGLLAPRGLFILSSHNRANVPLIPEPTQLRVGRPRQFVLNVLRFPWRLRNRRRLRAFEYAEGDYAIVNDGAHDYSLLHYYISRAAQARQLADHGFDLLECLDLEGRTVVDGEDAPESSELHYVARVSESS